MQEFPFSCFGGGWGGEKFRRLDDGVGIKKSPLTLFIKPGLYLYYFRSLSVLGLSYTRLDAWKNKKRCPCMAINVNVQYNGGLLPDIILLTQCYLHRGTCLTAMKRFCICSL